MVSIAPATGLHLLNELILLNQSVFQSRGVLVQDRRSFDPEVVNDGGGFAR